ncbi:hypothetical protein EC950183_3648, partial [Escherichia coli 95.0183]
PIEFPLAATPYV